MMIHLKIKNSGSIATPNIPLYTTPNMQISTASSTGSSSEEIHENVPQPHNLALGSNIPATVTQDYSIPLPTINVVCSRVASDAEFRLFRSSRLQDGNLDEPSTSTGRKHRCVAEPEVGTAKRYLGPQVRQPQDRTQCICIGHTVCP